MEFLRIPVFVEYKPTEVSQSAICLCVKSHVSCIPTTTNKKEVLINHTGGKMELIF